LLAWVSGRRVAWTLDVSLTAPYSRSPRANKALLLLTMSYTGFWNELRKIPPVTRFLCGSSLAVSIPAMLQLLSPYKVVFVWADVTQRFEVCFRESRGRLCSNEPQLWRVWSSFFYGGFSLPVSCVAWILRRDRRLRSQLSLRVGHVIVRPVVFPLFLFRTTHAKLSRNSNALELDHYPRRSPDYAWQLSLAVGAILVRLCVFILEGWHNLLHSQTLNLPLGSLVHSRALTHCILYLSSALAPPGSQTSLMGLITLPMQYLPYAMIGVYLISRNLPFAHPMTGLDLIMGGPRAAAVSVTGAVVGHLWWWAIYGEDGRGLPGLRGFGRAPSWVHALVSDGAGPNVAGTGVHVVPPRQQRAPPARALGYNWGSSGQRLGSE